MPLLLQPKPNETVEISRGMGDANTLYRYPFDSFPLLESHLHPKFIIFDAGKKLGKLLNQDSDSNPVYSKLLEDFPGMSDIRRLYLAWIKPPPFDAQQDTSYNNPEYTLVYSLANNEDIVDDELNVDDGPEDPKDGDYLGPRKRTKTLLGRGDGYVLVRRQSAAAEQAGNVVEERVQGGTTGATKRREAPSKKRKVLPESFTHNQQLLLSEAALSRINQQLGVDTWTAERIRQWSSWSSFPKKRRVVPTDA